MSAIIEITESNRNRFNPSELQHALHQFIGTERWYRHNINKRMVFTDGVRFFVENAGAHDAVWFIDKVAIEVCTLLSSRKHVFAVLSLAIKDDHTAKISVTDGNDHWIASFDIVYTDVQAGEWRFYLLNDIEHWVLLLPSEY